MAVCSRSKAVLSVLAVFAVTPLSLARAESPVATQARTLLKILPQETWAYHWQPRTGIGVADTGIVDPRDPQIRAYLSATSLRTWNDAPSDAIMGNGLYLAVDPVSSRSYGKNDWGLIAVPLRAGTVYLDVRKTEDILLSDESKRYIATQGCTSPTTLRRLLEWGAENACHQLALSVMKELKVNLLAYTWISGAIDFCDQQPSTAFMAASPDVLDLDQALIFTKEIPQPDPAARERAMIQQLYLHTNDFYARPLLWPDLANLPTDADIRSWGRAHLFGCGTDGVTALPERSTSRLIERFAQIRHRANDLSATLTAKLGQLVTVDPLRLVDLSARRFINRPDWEALLATGGWDPHVPYGAQTWDQWWQVATHEVQSAIDSRAPLTIALLSSWDKDAVINTVDPSIELGTIKKYPNFGNNLTWADSVTQTEINGLQAIYLPGQSGRPFLSWIPLYCKEELPKKLTLPLPTSDPECAKTYDFARQWVKDHPGAGDDWTKTLASLDQGLLEGQWYAYACWPRLPAEEAASREKQCGEIAYPDPAKVDIAGAFQGILDNINRFFDHSLGQPQTNFPDDPLAFALESQRQLVGLHPFNKGNGRVSRWVMDYITARSGLPPVMIRNMDFDLTTWWTEYELQGRAGSQEAMDILDRCLDRYAAVKTSADFSALQPTVCGLLK